LTSTIAAATFLNAANFISSLSGGKLKIYLTNPDALATYQFCLKVTDDSEQSYSDIVDNLSLKVWDHDCSDSLAKVEATIAPIYQQFNDTKDLKVLFTES
jgi:hypothetical protein